MTAVPTVASKIDLTQVVPEVKPSSIKDPYSLNYTIGVWMYVYNFNNQIDRFLMYGDTAQNGKNSYFSLRMDKTVSNLYCDILTNGSSSTPMIQSYNITPQNDTFPIQKWVYVVISVSKFIECYINGQFISAIQLPPQGIVTGSAPINPDNSATFSFGCKGTHMDDGTIRKDGCNVVLTGLSRWNTPLSAGDVYNNYAKGNGYETSLFGPAYHLNINLTQDTNKYTFNIF